MTGPNKKRVLTVFGTRPEAVKLAPLVLELNKSPHFESRVCVTGQHREILDQVLKVFDVQPEYDINLMSPNQDLFDVTSKALFGLKPVLQDYKPELVVVQGDTTTTFVAALAAFYSKAKVAHVEAGLRTGNKSSPFPEEVNRVLTSRLADFHFAPTEKSKENLLAEGISTSQVWVTGNTVIDSLFYALKVIEREGLFKRFEFGDASRVVCENEEFVLVTTHRRENFGQGIENICQSIALLGREHPSWSFVVPVHPNPNVQSVVREKLSNLPNVFLLSPQGYLPFVYLMSKAKLILTDSGGVQEEAPSLGKPVLVLRDSTERPEAVDAGTVKLVGTSVDAIVSNVKELMLDSSRYNSMSAKINPYGNGNSSRIITGILESSLQLSNPLGGPRWV